MRLSLRRTALRATFLWLAGVSLALSPASAGDWFVKASNVCSPCDGLSWATAYPDLQSGLAAAAPGDNIYVSVGTYYPDPVNRTAVFQLKDGVALRGGYQGVAIPPDPNDPLDPGDPIGLVVGRSTLSGDINTAGLVTDNSFSVVYADASVTSPATLDRFDILNDCFPGSVCRAVYVDGGTVSISNAKLDGGGDFGGAVFISSPGRAIALNSVEILGEALSHGGGLYCIAESLTIDTSSIEGTVDIDWGVAGGIYAEARAIHLRKVDLRNSYALDAGAGWLITHEAGRIDVVDSKVLSNSAGQLFDAVLGGLRLEGGTQTVSHSWFEDNFAQNFYPDVPLPTLALELRGAVRSDVINSLFLGASFKSGKDEQDSLKGTLVHVEGGGPSLFTSCTFYTGGDDVMGLLWSGSGLLVTNSIFNELHVPAILPDSPPAEVRFSYLPSPWGGNGSNNIIDPTRPFLLENPSNHEEDYRPFPGSPVIDAGNRADVPTGVLYDLTHVNPRRTGTLVRRFLGQCPEPPVDMGAFELIHPPACLADWDGSCTVEVADIFAYLRSWFAASPRADLNGDGLIDNTDLQGIFLPAWFAGCP